MAVMRQRHADRLALSRAAKNPAAGNARQATGRGNVAEKPAPVDAVPAEWGAIGCGLPSGLRVHLFAETAVPVRKRKTPSACLIIGIALYEAWKINKGRAVRIAGPFQLARRLLPERRADEQRRRSPYVPVLRGGNFAGPAGLPRLPPTGACHPIVGPGGGGGHPLSRPGTSSALACWRTALDLLPPGTNQSAVIRFQIEQLGRQVNSQSTAAPAGKSSANRSPAGKALAGLGFLGMLIWKLKVVALFVLTKGKLLLLGLTKSSTFLTMFVSFAAYWTIWGWRFALGLVVSLYIHEMGHVDALRRYGFKATAPMFIPGVGA